MAGAEISPPLAWGLVFLLAIPRACADFLQQKHPMLTS